MVTMQRGGTQWARQASQFAPDVEGTDTVFIKGGTAVGAKGACLVVSE